MSMSLESLASDILQPITKDDIKSQSFAKSLYEENQHMSEVKALEQIGVVLNDAFKENLRREYPLQFPLYTWADDTKKKPKKKAKTGKGGDDTDPPEPAVDPDHKYAEMKHKIKDFQRNKLKKYKESIYGYYEILKKGQTIGPVIAFGVYGKYEGKVSSNCVDTPHGHGAFTEPNGNIWYGEWTDGKCTKVIKMTSGQETYEGDFKFVNGTYPVLSGDGTVTFEKGAKLVGSYMDGKETGNFEFSVKGGTKRKGIFRKAAVVQYIDDGVYGHLFDESEIHTFTGEVFFNEIDCCFYRGSSGFAYNTIKDKDTYSPQEIFFGDKGMKYERLEPRDDGRVVVVRYVLRGIDGRVSDGNGYGIYSESKFSESLHKRFNSNGTDAAHFALMPTFEAERDISCDNWLQLVKNFSEGLLMADKDTPILLRNFIDCDQFKEFQGREDYKISLQNTPREGVVTFNEILEVCSIDYINGYPDVLGRVSDFLCFGESLFSNLKRTETFLKFSEKKEWLVVQTKGAAHRLRSEGEKVLCLEECMASETGNSGFTFTSIEGVFKSSYEGNINGDLKFLLDKEVFSDALVFKTLQDKLQYEKALPHLTVVLDRDHLYLNGVNIFRAESEKDGQDL